MRWILTALAAALMTGCASPPPPAPGPQPAVNLSGYPAEFKEGFTHGCASARPNAKRTRDEERYQSDSSYTQGWRDGYDICRRRK